MDCLRIAGPATLAGTVEVSGSKNAALPIMAASILADGPVTLGRIPRLLDVETLALVLDRLGLSIERTHDRLRIETIDSTRTKAPFEFVRRMRASFCVLGPLLAKRGRAVVSLPGGCNIGARPVDLHLAGLARLGADIRIHNGYVIAAASRLRGAELNLLGPFGPTVTGTANLLCAAALARGRSVLRGAAREPEIVDLGQFLIAMGARISGLGTDTIEVAGVESLAGTAYRIIPDRIEAGTFAIAAAATGGNITIRGAVAAHLASVFELLADAGAEVTTRGSDIIVRGLSRPHSINVHTAPYPGIPTDLQAQLMALASRATGQSRFVERVFPDRFLHVRELNRFGAHIERRGSSACVHGVENLTAARVTATDLRASAALVVAGLMAEGNTTILRARHLDRGYEELERKLAGLGAQIWREPAQVIAAKRPRARHAPTGSLALN
ncbi:MAG TPA: UDP-N-acetylglucosamine 1-carboxyvinyltransferase [Pirellulales bacterium]|jgi:UDP-N-acetylglucosamine 1-carboxyvinyltransferase